MKNYQEVSKTMLERFIDEKCDITDSESFTPFDDFYVNDFTFWQNNPTYYIYGGATQITILDEQTFIYRFDSDNRYDKGGVVHKIEISNQNDSLLYAGVNVLGPSMEFTIKSIDGGWSWNSISNMYEFLSLNPFNDQIFFARDEIYKNLYRTTDGGNNFSLVDSSMTYWEKQYHYDPDETHIYRVIRNFHTNNYELKVSSNSGEVSSWVTKYTSPDQIFISNNSSTTGEIYLANDNRIYNSTSYGDNFNLIESLDENIEGIYKKPNSNKLYAVTKYRMYEINLDDNSVKIIKNITPAEENYDWFPLKIGNYWVYEVYVDETGVPEFVGFEIKSIIDTLTENNGKNYFLYKNIYTNGMIDTLAIRLDSLTANMYVYSKDTGDELLFENLAAVVGDSVCYEYNPAWNCQFVQLEREFTDFGLNTLIKDYYPQSLGWYFGHSLVKGIGLYKTWNGDNVTFSSILKGCIINGVVYGDTTVVSVEDETPNLPKEFYLSQNYPNPFNPTTIIKYSIPNVARSEASQNKIVLKVYDVLGKEIATLVNEEKPPGTYEVTFNAAGLPSGVYLYRLTAGNFSDVKKLILIK